MQKTEIKHLGVRIAPEIHAKLAYVAKYEGRTINGQVYYLVQKCVRDFEKENGPITQEDLDHGRP